MVSKDHVHILARLKAKYSVSDFLKELKAGSSKWAKQHDRLFSWQVRYGAFTVSESQVDKVRRYISGQRQHHHRQSFTDEYIELLKAHGVEFDDRYLWN
jgi:putative transposase